MLTWTYRLSDKIAENSSSIHVISVIIFDLDVLRRWKRQYSNTGMRHYELYIQIQQFHILCIFSRGVCEREKNNNIECDHKTKVDYLMNDSYYGRREYWISKCVTINLDIAFISFLQTKFSYRSVIKMDTSICCKSSCQTIQVLIFRKI